MRPERLSERQVASSTVAGYQRAAADAITRFGGEVERYVGDGIMAYFGHRVVMTMASPPIT